MSRSTSDTAIDIVKKMSMRKAGNGMCGLLNRLEQAVFAIGVGLNLMSLFALAVGLAGAIERRVFGGALAAVAFANAVTWWRGRRGESSPRPSRGSEDSKWLWWLLAAAPFAAAMVLGGVLPPSAYDVREYHLQAPKEWFQGGAVAFLPHNIYANMPLGSELNSVWAMALVGGSDGWWWGAIAGKTVMACYSLVTAAALVGLGQRVHSLAAGVLAAVIYVSTPWIVWLAGVGYNEGPVAMYALLAIYALWLAHHHGQAGGAVRLIALAGFCAGSAVACKYPPVLFLVVPLAAAVFLGVGARNALVFLLLVGLACGPWLAKNAVLTGNPVYPLLYSWFDGATRTAEKDQQWTRVHSPQPDAKGRRFSLASLGQQAAWMAYRTRGANVAIFPLALAAFLVPRTRRTAVALAGWMLFVFFAWWLFTHRLDRFLVLLVPAAALLAGIGVVAIEHKAWRFATLGLVVWSLVAQFPLVTLPIEADNRYFAPLDRLRRDDPELTMGGQRVDAAHKWLNANVPPGKRVLLVGDAEPFDLEVRAIYNTCFDDCQFTQIFRGRSRQERAAELERRQISHVFVSWAHLARYRSKGNYGYTSDYVQPAVVHEELVVEQGLLRKVTVPEMNDERGELFEVVLSRGPEAGAGTR